MKVMTIYGEMDEKDLVKFEYPFLEEGARVTEYYLNKELVHRSAVVGLTGLELVVTAKI